MWRFACPSCVAEAPAVPGGLELMDSPMDKIHAGAEAVQSQPLISLLQKNPRSAPTPGTEPRIHRGHDRGSTAR
jgi:hypothetical protein